MCIDHDTGYICNNCILSMTQKEFYKLMESRCYIPQGRSVYEKTPKKQSLQYSVEELARMKKMRLEERQRRQLAASTKKQLKVQGQISIKKYFI